MFDFVSIVCYDSRMIQYKNSKKQGDAGLGQAIAYFTKNEYDVAIPLTDSCDWDLVVEKDSVLQRVQVKTSHQMASSGNEIFNLRVMGGNRSWSGKSKMVAEQSYDLLFVYHLVTGRQALIPRCVLTNSKLTLHKKYQMYVV